MNKGRFENSPFRKPRRELGEEGRPSVGVVRGAGGRGGAIATLSVLPAVERGARGRVAREKLTVCLGGASWGPSAHPHTATHTAKLVRGNKVLLNS